jgi:putative sugar O-methyltransferase
VSEVGFDEPSRFWRKLGQEHAADLERHGLDAIKRHQALRYFNWRWPWWALPKNQQLRFLLSHNSLSTLGRTLLEPASLSGPAWEGVSWNRLERWLYVYAVRLVWQYAEVNDVLGILKLAEPEIGQPLPVIHRGRLISQDLANSALEGTAIARALDGQPPRSILEVGAGYGRTAYALLSVFPEATYTIVDIEPAITISKWYLGQLFPAERLRFLGPSEALDLPTSFADLALSISTLQEMTPSQVSTYVDVFGRIARGGSVYLKQWNGWKNREDRVTLRFDDYPIPASWEAVFNEAAPVQSKFRQAAWRVPA